VPWINFSAVETLMAFSTKVHGVITSHLNYFYFDKAWLQQ
jgi:hypothetical protein